VTGPKRLSVAVIQGGPSTEAEVSRASAAGVATALAEAGHAVVRLELDGFLAESLRTGGYDVAFPAVHGAVGEDGALQAGSFTGDALMNQGVEVRLPARFSSELVYVEEAT